MNPARVWCLIAALFTLGGCASGPAPSPVGPVDARATTIFRGDGTVAPWSDVVEAAASADVFIIGETHAHALGLLVASELWADVLAAAPESTLSMEFFTRDEQSRVDDYVSGLVDEATFRAGTKRESDSTYPPGHRAMVEASKAAGRPVIASNAPRVYVRASSRESYARLESLSAEQRRMFRIPDALPTDRYREAYDALMSSPEMASHARPPGSPPETPDEARRRLDSGFRAQSLWDWTMGESIVRALAPLGGPPSSARGPVVHVVGRFHSDYQGGLVRAIGAMRPGTRVVTLSVLDATPAWREEDAGRADFVVYVGPSEE